MIGHKKRSISANSTGRPDGIIKYIFINKLIRIQVVKISIQARFSNYSGPLVLFEKNRFATEGMRRKNSLFSEKFAELNLDLRRFDLIFTA